MNTTISTIAQAIAVARQSIPPAEARLLLAYTLQQTPAWLLAYDDTVLDDSMVQQFNTRVARRAAGEPIAYLLGMREFYGREFYVAPGVLIPRPETELLVDVARQIVDAGDTARILDLGTGSGCIAITLALECPRATVTAIDVSLEALAVAHRNAEHLHAKLELRHSDWFSALEGEGNGECFDLMLGNPPYIAAADPHLTEGDLRHEPLAALASGADGLDALRHLITTAPDYLSPGGSLWLEHGYDQADAVRALLATRGFVDILQYKDLAGIVRVSGGVFGR